ncbi:MAG: twin-arginine translocation signal domain-containing protein [bacterium]|nr:twin-arginine translocation signal domain-containing protein [bacterium]
MPIHLGSTTRREFLAGTAGATAALLLGPQAIAEDKQLVDPHCFALLSDTHVPTDPKNIQRGANMTANFTKAISQVAGMKTAPAGAIFCGDLAYRSGLVTDYRRFASILAKLTEAKIPSHLILGNHDNLKNIYSVLANSKPAKPPVVGKHVSIIQSPRANWFLLDSLIRSNFSPGQLGPKQLKWLGKALDAHTDKPAIVMAHHDPILTMPLIPINHPQVKNRVAKLRQLIKRTALKDGSAMLKLLAGRKHVKAFINGHRHHFTQRLYKGLYVIGLPATGYMFVKGAATSWMLAHLKKTGMELELRCLDTKHVTNGQKTKLTWRT